MNTKEVASFLNVSESTVHDKAKSGQLLYTIKGKNKEFDEKSVRDFKKIIEKNVERNRRQLFDLDAAEDFKKNWKSMQRSFGIC